ncbi:serine/threonine protein kinase [Crinalium epipsammum PCC 9333]|uniref:non-specific serine/threonine protein kinase n=1 Tax=Crinalium epipsammum PCC 9333 TaxID=1173022 RepID=K9W597_9CYAN|nr:serine/threonine-protein kinase [Crinalium epipsammum]AFZ14969.1 serine/threonine protein kinase [Crinalium epipsammum PCC 9333]
MSLCINPNCPRINADNDNTRFCLSCGSELLLDNRYQVMRLLTDNNNFSKVYEAYEQNTPKIIKVLKEHLNTHPRAVELFQEEANILGQLNHRGIPQIDGYFQYQTRDGLLLHCIAIEHIEGYNFEELLQQQGNRLISEKEAIAYLRQIAEILVAVHSQDYYHWNIKPSNIKFAPSDASRGGDTRAVYPTPQATGNLVLIDFATARELTYLHLASNGMEDAIPAVISPGYTPPEQVSNQPLLQSDFYALGRTFVFLLTGYHPLDFYDPQTDEIYWRGNADGISPLLMDFLDWLMAQNPSDRPINANEILQRLDELERELYYSDSPFPLTIIAGLIIAFWAKLLRFPLFGWLEYVTSTTLRIIIFITVIITVPGVLAVVSPKVICSLGLSSDACPSQEPEKIGDIDYFPPEEGTDSQGKTAEFEVAVLSREYEWRLGSASQIQSNDEIIKVQDLQQRLEQQGVLNRLGDTTDIMSVGTASCEGAVAAEELRALQRAKNIQLLTKTLFGNSPTVKNYHLLNLGKFKDCEKTINPSETSYQRSLIIVGVSKKDEGVLLDEALYDRLNKKPFGDFKLEDYSLGSQERFQLTN